ncbi:MAG: hypothetical protein ACXWXS_08750 [Actinomycetota bacterium]
MRSFGRAHRGGDRAPGPGATTHVLTEGAPSGLDARQIELALASENDVLVMNVTLEIEGDEPG